MRLIYDQRRKRYLLECSFDERNTPKKVKFNWDPNQKKWYTENPTIAKKLSKYAADDLSISIDVHIENYNEIELYHDSGVYVLRCSFDDRHIAKDAGFKWDSNQKKWYTHDISTAYQLKQYAVDNLFAEYEKSLEASRSSEVIDQHLPVPKNLSYLPYQNAGIAQAVHRFQKTGCQSIAFFDEQGLGKTVESIGVANVMGYSKILVICPASLRLNWKNEINKWLLPELNNGVNVLLNRNKGLDPAKINITSYNLTYALNSSIKPELIIIDECHYLKNPKAHRTIRVLDKKVLGKSKIIFLSGTPYPNGKPNEAFPILKVCAPEVINNDKYWDFVNKYCEIEKDKYGIKIIGAKNAEQLNNKLRSSGFMIRRLKKDVLNELPDKQYKMVVLSPDKPLKAILKKEENFDVDDIIKFGMPKGSALPELRREMGLAKIKQSVQYIKDMLDSGTKKVVVFCHHTEVNRVLENHLKDYGAVSIKGDTPLEVRQKNIELFQDENSKIKAIIGNIQAMGVGHTLTQAHDVVMVEQSWVPGENEQAVDRCHRIGQENKVLVHYIVVEKSIDAKVLEAATKKAEDIDKLTS